MWRPWRKAPDKDRQEIAEEPEAVPPPPKPAIAARRRSRLSDDIGLGLIGVSVGLGCAFFPWYVFFNQEKFGIRPVRFDSEVPAVAGLQSSTPQIMRTADPSEINDVDELQLDTFATGTTPSADEAKPDAPELARQPFPERDVPYRLVHIANGRAMIEDASGLWIVKRGSMLPDMTRVTSIEQRDGEWVVVTSGDRVMTLTR
jgi:hypothetical protein